MYKFIRIGGIRRYENWSSFATAILPLCLRAEINTLCNRYCTDLQMSIMYIFKDNKVHLLTCWCTCAIPAIGPVRKGMK